MSKPAKNRKVQGRYYIWVVGTRNGVYRADGRSNAIDLGRHSLGTKDRAEAEANLRRLDLAMAVEHGMAEADDLKPTAGEELSVPAGRRLYEDFAGRPAISGGPRKSTRDRYRAVLDKFSAFLARRGIGNWNGVTDAVLTAYLAHLEDESYAPRTLYLEGTTVKTIVGYLVDQKRLPPESKLALSLKKPFGTDAYSWSKEEVFSILEYTAARAELRWLHWVLATLTYTGLRIGEAIDLRWGDIDLVKGIIGLVDESGSRERGGRAKRTTKGGRGRVLPIHSCLKPVLEEIPRSPDGYVFHGPHGGRLKADTARNIFVRDVLGKLAAEHPTPKGEIGFANGRLHTFRHFFCSLCATEGLGEQTVMAFLGHRDSKMVLHYFHLSGDEARRQIEKLSLYPTPEGRVPAGGL